MFACMTLQAQQPRPTDYQVKAAYLYNFGKFIQWPGIAGTDAEKPFDLCVLGQDPFGNTLDSTVSGETINGKNIGVRRISKPEEASSCRIVFISSSEDSRLRIILAALDKTPVLTVSDLPDFSRRGGMIQFLLEQNKVRFEVNLPAAQRAGLMLSSQLLKVATVVRKNSAGARQ